jgi:hypothetical protein
MERGRERGWAHQFDDGWVRRASCEPTTYRLDDEREKVLGHDVSASSRSARRSARSRMTGRSWRLRVGGELGTRAGGGRGVHS